MFAAGRTESANSAPQRKPDDRDAHDNDNDDDWLRVGRSFKGVTVVLATPPVQERALQVYTKSKKRSREKRRGTRNDSESDRESRHARKHGKERKKKKKKNKEKRKKHNTSRRQDQSDSESSNSSSRGSSDSDFRRTTKRKRRHESRESGRGHRSDEVGQSRRQTLKAYPRELALLEAPAHGKLEVYTNTDQYGDRHGREKLFEFDCAGDQENILFGTLYTHEQPLYRLATRRSVVDGAWMVAKPNRGPQPETKRLKQLDTNRYFGKEAKAVEKRNGTKRLHLAYSQRRLARLEHASAREEKQQKVDEMLFIPLDALVDGELDSVIPDGNHGGVDLPGEILSQSESATLLWQTDLENVERFIVTRQKELNERVTTSPHDIDAWLDVIAFQDQMQRLVGTKRLSENDLIFEKQKAVWAKATEKNPNSSRLHELQLNLLWRQQQAGGSVHETDSYRALVETLLESDRTSAALWAKLIQSAQQKFGSFSMAMLRDLYARVISVLNKELIEQLKTSESRPAISRSSSVFVHVVGTSSLLGRSDPYDTDALNDKAHRLSKSLIMFHRSMIRAEISAGFTERAVALAQALIEFNGIGQSNTDTDFKAQHQELVESFSTRWNGQVEHFGEVSQVEPALATAQLPGDQSVDTYCSKHMDQILQCLTVPEAIQSRDHELDLQGAFGEADADVIDQENDSSSRNTEGEEPESGGRWVYSNLHGQRIWIADTDESKEYERILNELRGSETSRDRLRGQERKDQSKHVKKLNLLKKLRDERADYSSIDRGKDDISEWLMRETRADNLQWKPLQPSNPEHNDWIEMQPDRAILTEEILPFVFRVPRLLHFSTVINLLEIVGVRLAASMGTFEDPTHELSLDDFSHFSLFTTPILKALDPSSTDSIALSSRDRYKMATQASLQHVKVSELATADPSRVQFIRNIFVAALHHFTAKFGPVSQLLKIMWMEFEVEVVLRQSESADATTALRSFCKGLLSQSKESPPGAVDPWLMSVYATVEHRLGNARQMARICDKTVASLDLLDVAKGSGVCRSFHRLVSMRVYQELSASNGTLGALKAFYLLWQVWTPSTSETLDSLLKQYRKTPTELVARLQAHREEHQIEMIGKYRIELQGALDQCGSKGTNIYKGSSYSCSVAFALSNLCSAIYATRGFQAAKQEFEYFLSEASPAVATSCHARQCWYMLFGFMQAHDVSERLPILSPREWRQTVARGVLAFPQEPLFLRLFVDAETSNTMSQSLRKYFQSRRQAWRRSLDSPELIEWLFALLCEFARAERGGVKLGMDLHLTGLKDRSPCCVLHRWGKNRPAVERIRRVFEEMMNQLKTSGSAIGWRLYLRFELAVGKVEAARKVFYRGLAKCPWCKTLYLDGLGVLRPYLSQNECDEISNFLVAKELHVRVDIQE